MHRKQYREYAYWCKGLNHRSCTSAFWPSTETYQNVLLDMKGQEVWLLLLNLLTLKTSLVILLIVYQMILIMLVWKIWYWTISNPIIEIFSLFSSLVCMILYWYSKEKFWLGHSWELKGSERILFRGRKKTHTPLHFASNWSCQVSLTFADI